MLYNVLYDGPKIDEILGYANKIKAVSNGWIKQNSTSESPVDLNQLIRPGNFNMSYWKNGPENGSLISPLNMIVTNEQGIIRQYAFSTGYIIDAWFRTYNPDTSIFTDWQNIKTSNQLYVSDTAPDNPTQNMIWINTSNSDAVIQYYDGTTNQWEKLNPYDYMDPSIYNPNNIGFQDVYTYIDNKVKNVSGETGTTIDYMSHINDDTIHVTSEDKANYESKMTSDNLLDAINGIIDELKVYIASKSSSMSSEFPEIESLAKALLDSLKTHIEDVVIHPTQSQIDNWNSKSDKEHTHTVNQIKIDVKDVVGILSAENFSDEVKERQVTVASKDALLALTINEVQNGDFVLVNYSDTKNELYIVVDQTKLGTSDAFIVYNEIAKDISWSDITDKPTTITDLDIIDLMINRNTDILLDNLETTSNDTNASVNNTSAIYDNCTSERIANTHKLETEIDDTDQKLNYLYEYVTYAESIVSTLEGIVE